METLRRFRLIAVKLTLALSLPVAILAYWLNAALGKGFLLGALAGTVIFWHNAYRVEKNAQKSNAPGDYTGFVWTTLYYLAYIGVLYRGYQLDAAGFRGFWGAVAGVFVIRGVVSFLGVTGLDLTEGRQD